MDIFNFLLETGFWMATIRMATPLIFGTLGELICERAGVLNLGIEGIMAAGCMAGWTWVYLGGDLWTGIMFAAFIGALFGLLHSLFTVHLGLSQHVTGLGITMLASALTSFIFRMLLPKATTPPKIVPFQTLDIPVLSQIPFVGEILFSQSALTYLAFLAIIVVSYVLFRTPIGLAVRMTGENPMAVEAQGLSVFSIAPALSWSVPHSWLWVGPSSPCPPLTPTTSAWSTDAAGSASPLWSLHHGNPARRCSAASCLLRSTPYRCAYSNSPALLFRINST